VSAAAFDIIIITRERHQDNAMIEFNLACFLASLAEARPSFGRAIPPRTD
jgi:hypothetical protein